MNSTENGGKARKNSAFLLSDAFHHDSVYLSLLLLEFGLNGWNHIQRAGDSLPYVGPGERDRLAIWQMEVKPA